MKMTDETLFIKIDTPVEFRKALLMSIRDLIHSLQRHDTVKQIRIEKAEQIVKLKKISKEIEVLLNRINSDMPSPLESRKKDQAVRAKKIAKGKSNAKGKAVKAPKMSEMQKLEGQLRDIEGKLKDM